MNQSIVHSDGPILLVGGADCDNRQLISLLETVKAVVGVDRGADRLQALGVRPDAVIGDLDSVSAATRDALPTHLVHHIAEQDSTDFDKALRNVTAPLVLGAGFLGSRLDHQLAAMTVLVRRAGRRAVLVGDRDLVMLAPPDLWLDLPLGSRLSLFPMRAVSGRSDGLRWPIDGLRFAPDGAVGTSNEVTGPVRLRFDTPGMLLILPVRALSAVQAGLALCPDGWPAP
ncbi:thiamine diphosphokinase [Aestuariicoccus sp. MJ-SS9]|uniref:thiamine diphosphokinase n=1 Tax=Aestuariicoccus sp. MJ-SS9 TaxID=3079855 RepID=UPI00291328AF|nr:thiamine diphosphokinase [Aestuariicoccus sp. MJ-SS9]MDU8913777.1 thiamine diphosphokinase [Aestuariicoccus sp. MJ-SS9]